VPDHHHTSVAATSPLQASGYTQAVQTTYQQTSFPNPISEDTKQQWEEVITLFHPGLGAVKQ
jgi:hypothetical protein